MASLFYGTPISTPGHRFITELSTVIYKNVLLSLKIEGLGNPLEVIDA